MKQLKIIALATVIGVGSLAATQVFADLTGVVAVTSPVQSTYYHHFQGGPVRLPETDSVNKTSEVTQMMSMHNYSAEKKDSPLYRRDRSYGYLGIGPACYRGSC